MNESDYECRDESFDCRTVVKEFMKSFDSSEECAKECTRRQKELVEQLQAYVNCIHNLLGDKRYIPIVFMKQIGVYIGAAAAREDGMWTQMKAGMPSGIEFIKEHFDE